MKRSPTVPFVPNAPDDMHCVPAVFRMLYRYYYREDYSWPEIDEILRAIPGKGTWTFAGLTALAKRGLRIRNIEPVDYRKLHREGVMYLAEVFGKKTATYYLQRSNISAVIPLIPDFLNHVTQEVRSATISDIRNEIDCGALVGVEVNAAILNRIPGFSLHYVLLTDMDDRNVVFHDPGLPPIPGRVVPWDEFDRAFRYPGGNASLSSFRAEE